MTLRSEPAAAPLHRGRRRPSFWVGLGLVLTGLGLVGYVGWQLYGTTYVSQREQRQIVAETLRAWEGGRGQESAGGPPAVDLGGAEALIRIPQFGSDYVVPVQRGVDDAALSNGYGRFPFAAGPGQPGNYALAAHRITHGEPLRDMPSLGPGDVVVVQTREADYTYELDTDPNRLVVDFEDIWVTDAVPRNPQPGGVQPAQRAGQHLITLTTCSELFHTDNRLIAFGHLVLTTMRPLAS